jgi:HD superfamily phosphohydrolase
MIHSLIHSDSCPELSLEGVQAFLCGALLHDLGHFPFAHSLKELPLRSHENLTAELILETSLRSLIAEQTQADPEMVAAIIDLSISNQENQEIQFFRKLLSGVLDPDKLDYLTRDAFFCGVPYGVQDIDFIMDRISPHSSAGIAVQERGLPAVENILFSKYLMYRTVYWHRTVRIATAMIKKALYSGIHAGMLAPEDLYHLDDEQFFATFSGRDYAAYSLIRDVSERKLYKTLYELPFDDSDPTHQALTNLETRFEAEEELTGHVTKGMRSNSPLIIDVPEPISFEIDLPVIRNGDYLPFTQSSSVFSAPVVKGFTSSLRMIRVLGPQEYDQHVDPWVFSDYFSS